MTSSTTVARRVGIELVSLYLRRTKWETGRWRLFQLARSWAQREYTSECKRCVQTTRGFQLYVNLADWLGRHVFITGDYEPGTAAVMQAILARGDVMVDVGANIGFFTLLAAQTVGPNGRVYAFEPLRATRERLWENIRANKAAQVEVRAEALCDEQGSARFFVGTPDHLGMSSLSPLADRSAVVEVTTQRLDAILAANVNPAVVKIDVEGAEAEVLEGMRECIKRCQPTLVVEITDEFLKSRGHSAEIMCRELIGLGYQMYWILDSRVRPLDGWNESLPRQFNALFVHRTGERGKITEVRLKPLACGRRKA